MLVCWTHEEFSCICHKRKGGLAPWNEVAGMAVLAPLRRAIVRPIACRTSVSNTCNLSGPTSPLPCKCRINNAGEVTAKRLLADVEAGEVVRVVGTNVIGSLLG